MPLASGEKLGPYQIISLIGKGGMGEVYRAHDPRMGRDVAVKISAERFSERFDREVRAVASLNHPNICQIYDVGPNYLVMEFIEGEAPKGPLPVDEALRIAHQIGDALEAAHEKGIVHRDLKPGNIKIRPDGMVKVLDFGLAKQTDAREGASSEDSPTLSMAATQAGVVLGTAGYMSPEQARGKRVDKRADIWAFGVVLHELITGSRVFQGEDLGETMAAVIKEEPTWDGIPANLQRLLKSCLEKDPKKRLRDIGDAWRLLDEIPAAPVAIGRYKWLWPAIAAALVIALAVTFWAPWRAAPSDPQTIRFQIPLPEKANAANLAFAVSPDGHTLAFRPVGSDGNIHTWLRSLDSLEERELPGAESASIYTLPFFWSPDSRWIAYMADGKLKKIDVTGGPPQTIGEPSTGVAIGGSWNKGGVILFGQFGDGVMRVPMGGGTPTAVTTYDASQGIGHFGPTFLPDGRHFLYVRPSGIGAGSILAGALDAKPSEQSSRPLQSTQEDGYTYVASPSGNGQLLFMRERTLMAQELDDKKLALVGEAAAVAGNVASFSASATGILVYRKNGSQNVQLSWLDRDGKTISTVGDAAEYANVSLSPDATKAVVLRREESGQGLWLVDLLRGNATPFTSKREQATNTPVWSPKGDQIVFSHFDKGTVDLWIKPVDGSKDEEILFHSADAKYPASWSHDGRFLLYNTFTPKEKGDLWVLPLDSHKPTKLLGTEADEAPGQFSPDGKWIAYPSDETGRMEVYVRPFLSDSKGSPAVGPKIQISKAGGGAVHWREDGKELFIYSPNQGGWYSVVTTNNAVFPFSEPKLAFKTGGAIWSDIAGDGKRFFAAVPVAHSDSPPFTVVLNWQAGVKK